MEHMQDFNGCRPDIVKDQIVAIDSTAKSGIASAIDQRKTPGRPAD
jgi:hypothetical protein